MAFSPCSWTIDGVKRCRKINSTSFTGKMAAFDSKNSTKSLQCKAGHFAPHIPVKREVFLQCGIKHVLTEWGFCLLVAIYVRKSFLYRNTSSYFWRQVLPFILFFALQQLEHKKNYFIFVYCQIHTLKIEVNLRNIWLIIWKGHFSIYFQIRLARRDVRPWRTWITNGSYSYYEES